MANLHIIRDHALGLAAARKIAQAWAQQAESEFGMACTYQQGKTADTVAFSRSGVNGTLQVDKTQFALEAKLGFLLGTFKDKIEAEVVKNLDALLASQAAPKKPSPRKGAQPTQQP